MPHKITAPLAFLVALLICIPWIASAGAAAADNKAAVDKRSRGAKPNVTYRWVLANGGTVLEFDVLKARFQVPTEMIGSQPHRFPLELVVSWPDRIAWRNRRPTNMDAAEANARRLFISLRQQDLRWNPKLADFPSPIERGLESGRLGPAERRPGTRFLDCFPLKSTGNCRYYVSNDGVKDVNGKTIRISCGAPAGETSDRYRRCSVTFQIAEGVTVYYNFYDKYIGDWKTIHKVISGLLVSEEG